MHGLVNSTSWGRYSFCYLCYTRQDKKQMLNKEGKTIMTYFLIREKQPDFNSIQEEAGHLHARTVSAVTLHLWGNNKGPASQIES